MAAGRYGGYRHDSEFDVKSSRRKDYHHDRYRDDDRERGRVVDLRDRLSDRRRDDRAREVVNGYHRSNRSGSNSSGSGSELKRVRSDEKLVEREPGELSSGGESPVENSVVPSPGKKRKISPISQEMADGRPSPNAPTLQNGYVSSRPVVMEQLPEENATRGKWWQDDQEPGEMVTEDEENAPMRNISSSRWADGDDFMDDGVKTMAKMKKENSPELGEVASREGSQGTASNPSSSDGEHKDDCKVQDVEGNDYMDIDEKDDGGNSNSHSSDTESESGDSGVQTPDPPETPGQEQPPERSLNMTQGCRSVDEFERLNKINEGTYGVVYRAMDKKTGEIVALKKVKMEKEREGFPLTSLREINILLSLQHPSIVGVKEVVVGSNLDSIFMVMEYMDHDLKALMEAMKQPFSQSEVKCLMLQLLEGINYLHDNWVLHRDLKTSNLLVNNCGELKICDFGLSRQYGSPLKPYTHLVVTLWYRAPELLLGAKEYSTAIDMWSLGCILAELLAKEPLFSGKNELDQLDKIFRILGTPNEKIWPRFTKLPGVKMNFVRQPYNKLREKFPPITSFSGRPTLSEAGFDLLNRLLTYDPDKRITAEDALNHPWFREVPLPKSKEFMPTYPAQNAHDRCKRRIMKSPDPLEEQRMKELKGDVGGGGLFG